MRLVLFALGFVGIALIWHVTPLAEYATPDNITSELDMLRGSTWAIPLAIGIYTLSMLVFFPHMVMTAAIVLTFAPLESIAIIMSASLISGSIGFFAGKKLGLGSLRLLIGKTADQISTYAKGGGIAGLTLLRMVPVAPFTAVNLVLGMSQTPYPVFIFSTVLGLLPGTLIAAFLGSSLIDLWQNPDIKTILYMALGLMCWGAVIFACHRLSLYWQRKHVSHVSA